MSEIIESVYADNDTLPNKYNVRRALVPTIPPCPLQPPPNLKTYKELREKRHTKSKESDAHKSSSMYSDSIVSDFTTLTTTSRQAQEHLDALQNEFPLEFSGKNHSNKADEKYLVYSQRELETMKKIVLLMLNHCPQTFNLLFDSKNATNISKGILAMTASTHTTIDFIQKIMKLEFEENAGTDRLMRENCPTNLLCRALFEAIITGLFLEKTKDFFDEFFNLKQSFEIDDLFVENDDEIESNFENLLK